MKFTRMVKNVFNRLLNKVGFEIKRVTQERRGGGYIDAAQTINAAHGRGISVCEYVEELWDQSGCTDRVIDEMNNAGNLHQCDRICEIGPGTGRYLERVMHQVVPKQYDIYEIADDWASWLVQTYAPAVVHQPTDGHTLLMTPDHSCGLVHAHGVFVYLSLLNAFEYILEMVRVCAVDGYVTFDFFSDEDFDIEVIKRWLNAKDRYPVILPYQTVLQFFTENGFNLVHEFDNKLGHSSSHYVIFQRAVE